MSSADAKKLTAESSYKDSSPDRHIINQHYAMLGSLMFCNSLLAANKELLQPQLVRLTWRLVRRRPHSGKAPWRVCFGPLACGWLFGLYDHKSHSGRQAEIVRNYLRRRHTDSRTHLCGHVSISEPI
jgi:hypothetical protein